MGNLFRAFVHSAHMSEKIKASKKDSKIEFKRQNFEASYSDQFNMTENGLEYDRMKFTPTNVNDRT